MTRCNFADPPPTPKNLERQRAILVAMAERALVAYASFAAAMAFLARPAIEAFRQGSILAAVLTTGGLVVVYVVVGGALCVAFVSQLRDWPPPGPRCSIVGARFVRTWLWAAPHLLIRLGGR